MRIQGQTVILVAKVENGKDAFNAPIYDEVEIEVENVLIEPVSTEEIVNDMELYGKKTAYILHIPKGDTAFWQDRDVIFFGKRWHTFGGVIQYPSDMVPLDWDKKVRVASYE